MPITCYIIYAFRNQIEVEASRMNVLSRAIRVLPDTRAIDVQKAISKAVSRHYLLSVILIDRRSAQRHRRERWLRWSMGLPKTEVERSSPNCYVFPATVME